LQKEEMTLLNESTTIAIFLCLVFGAVSFYLWSRLSYTEKKMSLMESMLLDMKMSLSTPREEEGDFVPEPVGEAEPLQKGEVDTLPEEENYYKNVLEQVASEPAVPAEQEEAKPKVTPNYESMTKPELLALVDQRSITLKQGKRSGRNDIISALRKWDENATTGDVSGAASELFPMAAELGEEVEGEPMD
jgi:hypothetical protein